MTASDPTSLAGRERVPAVLAVVVVRDGASWLRECLGSLAAQTYPRLGVLAVDDGSRDGSRELLVASLGTDRVLAITEARGLAGAVDEALALPVAAKADYVLVVHDDAVYDPDVVTRLVQAAIGIRGLEGVGVVGAKIVERRETQLLLDVGRSADRFGHPYTPLQPGEIDQGQFDRVLEVFCVSSCAMLISRDAWQRVGGFDDRLDDRQEELDFCWRARLAGFRVLMTPLARVRHRAASSAAVRSRPRRRNRYEEDRAALASMLRNYSALSLVRVLPLALLLSLARLAYLTLARRFEEAFDVLAAWGWNIARLPGTLRRRFDTQRTRVVKDRQLRRFMESTGLRLPRWFQTAERIFEEQRELDLEEMNEPTRRRLRDRTASLASEHPVIVGSFVAIVVGLLATRGLFGPERLIGGALPSFPSTPGAFLTELASGTRTTGLGGSLAASPALGLMGGLSWLLFGSTALAQKALLVGGVAAAAVLAYRAIARLTGAPGPSVVAAAAYGLSAVVLWSFSQGRVGLLVGLAVLPAVAERLEVACSRAEPGDGRWRFVAGLGVSLAIAIAFFPGIALAVGILVAVHVVGGHYRVRGLGIAALSSLVALVLLFPFVPTLLAGGAAALGAGVGSTDPVGVLRLALGAGPGSTPAAMFLPIAAFLSFGLARSQHRGRAVRAMVAALAGLVLAWLSGAGYLPRALSNAQAYAGLAAVAEAMLVGYGLASVVTGLGLEAFGLRQVGTALLAGALGAGLAIQAVASMIGGWAVGSSGAIPPAYAVVASAAGDGRILWLGDDRPAPFPAPGGDPQGRLRTGTASVRWSLTTGSGATALDVGRPLVGPGSETLEDALVDVLAGTTVHGGALLAPLGVRFVVAPDGDLAAGTISMLDRQVDLDRIPAEGLVIYRDARTLPPAAVIPRDPVVEHTIFAGAGAAAQLRIARTAPLRRVEGGWDEHAPVARGRRLILLSTEYDGAWDLTASDAAPSRAFGWATAFAVDGGPAHVRYGAQLPRTIELWLLGGFWAAALWVTRKPVAR
jgi:GT2 family glycosyltransferase